MELDTDVVIIGAGMSGLGFAVQLVREYGHRNFEIYEKSSHIGGTCEQVRHQKHARFRSIVTSANWDEESGTWLVSVKDLETSETYDRRCKILVSAVGALSKPKGCDIPGASSFHGPMFHTAEWDHSFDWKGKELVVIGNGCSATQVVPAVSEGDKAVKKVVQFARQAQWIFERPNPEYTSLFKWTMRWVPFAMRGYRALQNFYTEFDFQSFPIESGAPLRKMYADYQGAYIRRTAPKKYLDFLVPKTEIGCKRRVMDTYYLDCLHRDNVELVYEDPIEEIVEDGVRTKSGRVVDADAIVLANGFEALDALSTLNIHGEGGLSIADHWDTFSEGAPSSYFGTCLSGFPNFFILMGPNTASGHGSVAYTSECQISFTLRLIKPILKALKAERSRLPVIGRKTDIVTVRPEAEQADIDTTQDKLKTLIWSSGCTSWALDPRTGRNLTMYPDFQTKYWLRSIFIPWDDFEFSTSKPIATALGLKSLGVGSWLTLSTGIAVVAYLMRQRSPFGTLR
ncbi:hypothetical protein O1611_g7445 [Lasiodiplodia mahajangana]|uniref:Uncharacterized protein n=1 Tax=Lasiodiplodia mahajangana TaxID=1108764 RepID=A0ACC2JG45_9PEZI|nr:hypothetical protein O1611_g7445 [Lasiodiplodia mahajangana]